MLNSVSIDKRLLALPRFVKRVLVMGVDAALCALSVVIAYYLRLGELPDDVFPLAVTFAVALVTAIPTFAMLGLYRAVFRHSGWSAMSTVLQAVLLCSVPMVAIISLMGVSGVPRTIGVIQPIILLLLVGLSRGVAKAWLGEGYRGALRRQSPVLIYGAGSAGRQLASALASGSGMRVVGYLDDDQALQGQILNGLPIFAPQELDLLIADRGVTDVLLALPSSSRMRRNEIIGELRRHPVHVQTLPGLSDLALGKVRLSDLRELEIDDLLGRDPVEPARDLLLKNVAGRTVLVTGAGGSIGSELCRQILALGPARLLLLDVSEYALYSIRQELLRRAVDAGCQVEIVPLLASVRDKQRLTDIMRGFNPDTIYHAAAYKHVPLVEHNIAEGIRNNVLGTMIVAHLAVDFGVSDFVLISTDKAVRPTNVMGASKRLAELVLQALAAEQSNVCFSMVRFGNVLGSSGSVVPLFRQQIKDGGPVTVTHPDITRYFMTIPEAAQLVIQAGAMATGGEVFVLDMGEPVRIIDLARKMIELSGLTVRDSERPDGDVEIITTGLRPGEKLYEELLIGNDPAPTSHPRILKASERAVPMTLLETQLASLFAALDEGDLDLVRERLKAQLPEYQPNSAISDALHISQQGTIDVTIAAA